MRILLFIALLFFVIIAMFIYAQIDLASYFAPAGDGTFVLLSLFLGMLGDIVVIGFLVAYIIQSSEREKWKDLSVSLDRYLADDAITLLHTEAVFTNDVLDFIQLYGENDETGMDVAEWRLMFLHNARLMQQGHEIVRSCRVIADTVKMFPIQFAKRQKELVAVGVSAAQVSEQSVIRTASLVTNQAHNLSREDVEQEPVRDFIEAASSLYDELYSQVHQLYAALIVYEVLYPRVLKQAFNDEAEFRAYVSETLLPTSVNHARGVLAPELAEKWLTLIGVLLDQGYADKLQVQGLLDLYGPGTSLLLWKGTKKELRLTAPG